MFDRSVQYRDAPHDASDHRGPRLVKTGPPVAGELDTGALGIWLQAHAGVVPPLRVDRIAGGRSNLTYRVTDATGRGMVLRRPPPGRREPGAHDMLREYRVLGALAPTDVPVPRVLAHEPDSAVLGAEFYVCELVDGLTLRSEADALQLDPAARAAAARAFIAALAALHRVDPAKVGLDRPARPGPSFVARQLALWSDQLRQPGARSLTAMHAVADRLAAAVPSQARRTIVHGDFRLDNVLLSPAGDVRAVLDWELWTLGDPLADLGAALAYWVDPGDELVALGETPTTAPGFPRRAELAAAYAAHAGVELPERTLAAYVAFGTWRFAAILEGVYRRNLSGDYGDDPDGSWRRFETVVPALADRAAALLDGAHL
jgi:aminoglycoside phosphotransferase (APT) family kinase protein